MFQIFQLDLQVLITLVSAFQSILCVYLFLCIETLIRLYIFVFDL